jgi:hypothetical protein
MHLPSSPVLEDGSMLRQMLSLEASASAHSVCLPLPPSNTEVSSRPQSACMHTAEGPTGLHWCEKCIVQEWQYLFGVSVAGVGAESGRAPGYV